MAAPIYFIAPAKPTGGKAGKGRNKTSTLRVIQEVADGRFWHIKKTYRFTVDDPASYALAMRKARLWVRKLEAELNAQRVTDERLKAPALHAALLALVLAHDEQPPQLTPDLWQAARHALGLVPE